jgi:hypothetical protein
VIPTEGNRTLPIIPGKTLYRQPMETGQSLRLWIDFRYYGDAVRYSVWAPDGSFVASGMLCGSYVGKVRWVHNTEEGVYQIEVRGLANRSEYRQTIVPCEGPVVQMEDAFGAAAEGDDQPIVPPTSVPSRHFGLPSAPLPKKHVYLPVVLRSHTP